MSENEPLVVRAVDVSAWALDNSENARSSLHAILQEYREVEGGMRNKGEKKPDMQAFSQLKHLTPTVMFGHVPGMLPGDVFKNRGELAVLGGHTQYSRGIDNRVADLQGARAIVLSGGYKDDTDLGSTMWYTGQGGQKKKQQVEDQEWVRDNLGLKRNAQTGTPVRVFRGSRDSAGDTQYTYEGLYAVKEARRVKSKDGPLICQFLLDGLPNGHSVASTKVEFRSMNKKAYQPRTRLAAPDENSAPVAPRPSKKSKVPMIGSPEAPWGPTDRKAREARRAAAAKKPGLVCVDLSNGLEPHVPIPCYNELGDGEMPPRLNYTPDYKWHPRAKELLSGVNKALDEQMLHYRGGHECSMAFNQAMMLKDQWAQKQPEWLAMSEEAREELDQAFREDAGNYNQQGCLFTVDWFGLHECSGSCAGEKCQGNKVVTRGITLPLEVYRDQHKGWSVRCAADIPVGAFVCAYIGELVLEDEAHVHERSKDNQYLYSLDHFSEQATNNLKMGMNVLAREVPLYKVPPPPPPDLQSALRRYPPLRPTTAAATISEAPTTTQQQQRHSCTPASQELSSSPQEQVQPAATPGQQQQEQQQQQQQQEQNGMDVEEGMQCSHLPCTNQQQQQEQQKQGQQLHLKQKSQVQQQQQQQREEGMEGVEESTHNAQQQDPAYLQLLEQLHEAQQRNLGDSEGKGGSALSQNAQQQDPAYLHEAQQLARNLIGGEGKEGLASVHEAQQQRNPVEKQSKASAGLPPAAQEAHAQHTQQSQQVQQGASAGMEGGQPDPVKSEGKAPAGSPPAVKQEHAQPAAQQAWHSASEMEGVEEGQHPQLPSAVQEEQAQQAQQTQQMQQGASEMEGVDEGQHPQPPALQQQHHQQQQQRMEEFNASPQDDSGGAGNGYAQKNENAEDGGEKERRGQENGRAQNDDDAEDGGEGREGDENGSGVTEEQGERGESSRGRGRRRGRGGAKLTTKAQRREQRNKSKGPERVSGPGAEGRGQGASGSGVHNSAGVEMIGEDKQALARSNMGIGQGVLGFGAPGVEEKPVDVGNWAEETEEWDNLLVIDAQDTGNVARFVNHACGSSANLLVQPVFARDCNNQILHYLGLFAGRPIPKGTELTYDYGRAYHWPPGQQCKCGSPECRGFNAGLDSPVPAPRAS